MGIELRMPSITGTTEREMLSQIRSYLYQFVPQLQWALNNIDTMGGSTHVVKHTSETVVSQSTPQSEVSFDKLKSLIIKSAEIVDAYYEKISARIVGLYVAQSDFGTFVEQTEQNLTQTSTEIEQAYENLQQILTDIDNLNFTLAEANAHIKSGLLYYDDNGIPVYGLEIGQKNSIDGKEVFNKFARFTAGRLSFYDQNDTEIAYISDYKLFINDVEIKGSFKEGGYKDFIDSNGGIVTKWVGGE